MIIASKPQLNVLNVLYCIKNIWPKYNKRKFGFLETVAVIIYNTYIN